MNHQTQNVVIAKEIIEIINSSSLYVVPFDKFICLLIFKGIVDE